MNQPYYDKKDEKWVVEMGATIIRFSLFSSAWSFYEINKDKV